MAKTKNINLELTEDNTITFLNWREIINGNKLNGKSNMQIIDDFAEDVLNRIKYFYIDTAKTLEEINEEIINAVSKLKGTESVELIFTGEAPYKIITPSIVYQSNAHYYGLKVAPVYNYMSVSQVENCIFENYELPNCISERLGVVNIDNALNIIIKNCKFHNVANCAVNISGTNSIIFSGCEFIANTSNVALGDETIVITDNGQERNIIEFNNCRFNNEFDILINASNVTNTKCKIIIRDCFDVNGKRIEESRVAKGSADVNITAYLSDITQASIDTISEEEIAGLFN